MPDAARVYADALFEVAKEKGKLDAIRDQLGQFADAVDGDRELQVFFFSPYFSSAEKVDGLKRAIAGADPELVNFLELLIEKHRMPEIFRIRRQFEELWKQENRRHRRDRDQRGRARPGGGRAGSARRSSARPAQEVELASRVDEEILGGIVLQVGNMVLDASIRNRLEKLRKSVAQAA